MGGFNMNEETKWVIAGFIGYIVLNVIGIGFAVTLMNFMGSV